MNNEEIIRNLYIALSDASINKDVSEFKNILADDYVLYHMTGMKQSKDDYISSVINGELKYYEAIHEDIKIIINKDSAKVIGKTKTLASPFGIGKSWWRLKQEMLLEKRGGKWVIVSSVASTY